MKNTSHKSVSKREFIKFIKNILKGVSLEKGVFYGEINILEEVLLKIPNHLNEHSYELYMEMIYDVNEEFEKIE